MRLIVLAKVVPDTYGERTLVLETGLADRATGDQVMDEISERALEAALAYADEHEGTEISLLTIAPADATATIRKGLAMGADRAIHIVDDALVGADLTLTAEVLARAIERAGFDLVLAGNASTDGTSGMVAAAIAEHLGLAHASRLSSLQISERGVSGERPIDGAVQRVSASLPAVVSVTESLPDPRFPNFKGIMAAKKKPLEVLSLSDLGVDAEREDVARSIILSAEEKPARAAGTKIIDEGDAAEQLAAFLLENRLV